LHITEAELSGKRILVLEDEPFIAMDLERILRDAGATDISVAMKIEAAILAMPGTYDAAVIDLHIKGQSSLAFAMELSERHIPFVIVTGSAARKPRDPVLENVPVLGKPFDEAELVRNLLAETRRVAGQAA